MRFTLAHHLEGSRGEGKAGRPITTSKSIDMALCIRWRKPSSNKVELASLSMQNSAKLSMEMAPLGCQYIKRQCFGLLVIYITGSTHVGCLLASSHPSWPALEMCIMHYASSDRVGPLMSGLNHNATKCDQGVTTWDEIVKGTSRVRED